MLTPEKQAKAVEKLLNRLSASGFWGRVVVSMKQGNVVEINLSQTKRIDDLDDAVVVENNNDIRRVVRSDGAGD